MNDGKPWAFPKLGGLARRCSAPVAEVQTVALPCCSLEAAGVCMHRVCAGQDTQTPGSWARPCRHSCAMLLWLTVMLWGRSAPVLLGVCSKVISFLLAVMALHSPLVLLLLFQLHQDQVHVILPAVLKEIHFTRAAEQITNCC